MNLIWLRRKKDHKDGEIMSGIKTHRKKTIVDEISRIIIHCQIEKRLETRSDIRRCGKMIYRNLEEFYVAKR